MTRRGDEDEPALVPVFDSDLKLRQGHWAAYIFSGILTIVGIVGMARASWLWVFPTVLAVVAIVANARARRAVTYGQAFLWLALVGVGVFGGIGVCVALAKRDFS
jgi:hypothetical protein